jgi:golgi phosphoprotein 3
MSMPNSLFLHEELMLLALRDEEGTIASSGGMYQYAISGAVVAELLLRNRIEIEESKKQFVNLINSDPVGDPLIDECLERIAGAKKRASLQTWVVKFVGIKNLKHRVAEGLCKRGILQPAEDRVLLVFSRKTYPELDPQPERELVDRLRRAIFTDSEDVDPRTAVLVSLASGTGMLNTSFDRKELKSRKARIEQVISGETTGQAAKQAIAAMQAVIFMSTITATAVIN